MNTVASDASWADSIAKRAGTYGLGLWLPRFAQWLGDADYASWLPANEASDEVQVRSPAKGIAFALSTTKGYDTAAAKIRPSFLVLDDIVFNAQLSAQVVLPFGLNLAAETVRSAAEKIGTSDTTAKNQAANAQRVSFFLDDLRVVEISWTPQGRIQQVLVSRLWQPVLFGAR